MKNWFKYSITDHKEENYRPVDKSFSEHSRAMGTYASDKSYGDDELLFRKFFYGFHDGRLERYYDFISDNLDKNIKILSIGSGRGILEYFMRKRGYTDITCSDLEIPEGCGVFHKDYIKLNILEETPEERYDAIISCSMIYLFNDDGISALFKNVKRGLKPDGIFILDSAGSPDTLLSTLINECYLRLENWLYRFYRSAHDRRWYHIQVQHFGYRRTDREIILMAIENGFTLKLQENYNFLTDCKRSMIFRKIIEYIPAFETISQMIVGKRLPYIRLFKFQSK